MSNDEFRERVLDGVREFAALWGDDPRMVDHLRGAKTFAETLLVDRETMMGDAVAMVEARMAEADLQRWGQAQRDPRLEEELAAQDRDWRGDR